MPVTINYVWLSNSEMGPLEKFNIYSWKALGHKVQIFAVHWNGRQPTASTLGLAKLKDSNVFNLLALVGDDDFGPNENLPATREVLRNWYELAMNEPPASANDFVYNMVDVSKSYVGATQVGIVLDLKVGPSRHLPEYEACFRAKFISYSRGGNTPQDWPENQCMGTMQEGHNPVSLRGKYAAMFEKKISAARDDFLSNPNGKYFNSITSYHGWAARAAKYLDVAEKTPAGQAVGSGFPVEGIQGEALDHGPFRVFKKASDQSNKSSGKTTAAQVRKLCQQVWENELHEAQGAKAEYLSLVEGALDRLPR